jgi:hypothetical protein
MGAWFVVGGSWFVRRAAFGGNIGLRVKLQMAKYLSVREWGY